MIGGFFILIPGSIGGPRQVIITAGYTTYANTDSDAVMESWHPTITTGGLDGRAVGASEFGGWVSSYSVLSGNAQKRVSGVLAVIKGAKRQHSFAPEPATGDEEEEDENNVQEMRGGASRHEVSLQRGGEHRLGGCQ